MTAEARLGRFGAVLLVLLVGAALVGPIVAPGEGRTAAGASLEPPSRAHPLGTDDIGQDLLHQLLVGARISLTVGLLGALLAIGLGIGAGLGAGVAGGVTDLVLMRLVDVALTLPMLPLMIVLHVWVGSGLAAQILVIGAVLWARTARLLRAQVLSSRERGSVSAARVMGAGPTHLLRLHLLPAVVPLLIPESVRAVSAAITLETSLSFLGFGDPSNRSWGTILFYAQAHSAYLTNAWLWWIVPPGLCVGATVFAFAAIGYALEGAARPPMTGVRPRSPREPRPVAPEPAAHLVDVGNVTIVYGQGPAAAAAVRGVSLTIDAGEIVGLVGESGSGKSTLAGALLHLERPPGTVTAGRVLVDGHDLALLDDRALRSLRGRIVALAPQSAMNALNPVQRIDDQIAEAVRVHHRVTPAAARRQAHDALESVGIARARVRAYPHELSGGMRQRAILALAMINRPRLLIADEPTSGLDLLTQRAILGLLATMQRRGSAVLLISHDLGAVAAVADRIVVMQDGMVVEQGPARAVLTAPSHPYTRRLADAVPRRYRARPPAETAERGLHAAGAPVLAATNLRKSYRGRGRSAALHAVEGVSFAVGPGECVGLVGASGAGKSSVARLVVGLDRADCGHVAFAGDATRFATRAGRRALGRVVHLILQDPYESLPPHRRVRAIVAEPLRIHGATDCLAPDEALDAVGLLPARFGARFPHTLSGGERQRVALARALVVRPRLIVADEPTSLLDSSRRREMLALMRDTGRQFGTAYLYITHDLALAWSFCDRLLVMDEGRIVEEGSVAELVLRPRHPQTAALVRAAEDLAFPEAAGVGACSA